MPWWGWLLVSGGVILGLVVGAVVAIGWFGSQMFRGW